MKQFKKAYRCFTLIESYLVSCVFLVMVAAICYEVVMRKITGNSLPWLEEFSRAIFIIITLVGASVGVTADEHPRMTAVLMKLGGRASHLVMAFTNLLCALFFAWIFVLSCQQVENLIRFGTSLTSINLKLWHIYLFFPLSVGGMVLRFLCATAVEAGAFRSGGQVSGGATA